MERYNLAARSLRHLRFARRMMAGQPLLARVSKSRHASAHVSLDGYQLPVGRVLRRLPLRDSAVTERAVPGDGLIDDGLTLPVETALRLLPRLPEYAEAAADTLADRAIWQTPPVVSDDARARDAVDGMSDASPVLPTPPTSLAEDAQPPVRAPMRLDGRRPHSRIVELPGVVSLPVAEEASEEDSSQVAQAADASPDTRVDDGGEGAMEVAADVQPADHARPPRSLPALDELPVVVSEEPAPALAPAVETPPAPVPASRRRGAKRAAPTPPTRASDALFPPTAADRTPQTWLARLRQAELPTPPNQAKPDGESPMTRGQPTRQRGQGKAGQTPGASYAPAQHEPAATPASPVSPASSVSPAQPPTAVERPAVLPDSSRATLRTMTGVDPAGVRIYRGPLAERVTATQNADALTDGDAIALGAGHATDTPETLGLLAHELTHVAHRRTPRFVPPIAQAPSSQQHSVTPPQAPQLPSQPAMAPANEESQAGWVEARVTNIARTRSAAMGVAQPPVVEQSAPDGQPAQERYQRDGARDMWGNLPAPWEPLPAWLTNPASAPLPMSSSAPAPQSAQQQPGQPTPAPAPSSGVPGTQRAERGRSLPDAEGEARHAAPAHEGDMPEPDLDALAQQVHAILKRRLAAERRRFG